MLRYHSAILDWFLGPQYIRYKTAEACRLAIINIWNIGILDTGSHFLYFAITNETVWKQWKTVLKSSVYDIRITYFNTLLHKTVVPFRLGYFLYSGLFKTRVFIYILYIQVVWRFNITNLRFQFFGINNFIADSWFLVSDVEIKW